MTSLRSLKAAGVNVSTNSLFQVMIRCSSGYKKALFILPFLLFITMMNAGGTCLPEPGGQSRPISGNAIEYILPVTDTIITIRASNPQYNCSTDIYCLDVEFQSNLPNMQLFGLNLRFLYEDSGLEFANLTGFQGGYGPITPNPPTVSFMSNGAPWNFSSGADYVNGAVQKVNANAPPIYISTSGWTKLFQICFTLDNAPDENNFCPPLVWDLEQNPANGGYPPGSAGIIMTVVNGTGSKPVKEGVDHFNWQYIGSGGTPYGQPIQEVCSSVSCGTCTLVVSSTADAGANSLRDIISCAAAGDTIEFAPSLAGSTITITSSKLIINKNLYIRSDVSPRIKITSTIPGLFEIATGKTVEFKDLDITSGITLADNSGAAFKNQGILRLIGVKVFKNASLGTTQYLVKNFTSSQMFLFGNCFVEIP